MHVTIVTDLTNSKKGPTTFNIAKWKLDVLIGVLILSLFVLFFKISELSLVLVGEFHIIYWTDSNLKLVFSSGIGDYLPVMDALVEFYVTEKVSEDV